MKRRDQDWAWTMAVVLDARDALRSEVLPALEKSMELAEGDLREELARTKNIVHRHCERLRHAVKGNRVSGFSAGRTIKKLAVKDATDAVEARVQG